MASKKFFNQKVKKKAKIPTGTIVIITICVFLIIIAVGVIISVSNNGKQPANAVIEIRDTVATEVNTKIEDVTVFFTKLENVAEKEIKVDTSKVDYANVGEYDVTITLYKKTYSSKVIVVDTESPVLELKEHSIGVGEAYTALDFVKSCQDNSGNTCTVSFYKDSIDQNGNAIDFANYTEKGTYTIMIVAEDESGNVTTPVATSLVIGGSSGGTTISCKYGNSAYDTNEYILAVDVTENGCALDLNLYQSSSTLAPAQKILDNELTKLKNEFKTLNLNVKDIYLNTDIGPVLNTTGSGVVGYTIFVELSIYNSKDEKEIIASYYLTKEGSRVFNVNTYKLKTS